MLDGVVWLLERDVLAELTDEEEIEGLDWLLDDRLAE